MKHLFIAALLAAVLPLLSGAAKNAWDIWREGYETYHKGEILRDRGEHSQALETFRRALALYQEIQRARPDWDQNIIKSRIADCEREIANARKLLGDSNETVVPARPEPKVENYRKRVADLTAANEALQKEIERLKANEVDALKLLREQRVLQEKCALLEKQKLELEKKGSDPGVEVEKLSRQLVEEKLASEQLGKRLQRRNPCCETRCGSHRIQPESRTCGSRPETGRRRNSAVEPHAGRTAPHSGRIGPYCCLFRGGKGGDGAET